MITDVTNLKYKISAEDSYKAVQELATFCKERYVYEDIGKIISEKLLHNLNLGIYDQINDIRKLALDLERLLAETSKDKHLHIWFQPEKAMKIKLSNEDKEEKKKQTLERAEIEKSTNYGFKKLEILEGNIGYLDLTYFAHTDYASNTAVTAMNFFSNVDALIIDLRYNGGGESRMVQLLSSYFLPNEILLHHMEKRYKNAIEQYWTLPYVPGKRMLDIDLYLLSSSYTFSGAEDFIYNLVQQKRAVHIGEKTNGGAHPCEYYSILDKFVLLLPVGKTINPITKTNWEGVGVSPEIEVSADKALSTAYTLAIDNLRNKTEDEESQLWYMLAKEEYMTGISPKKLDNSTLENYVGIYEGRNICLENDSLYYKSSQYNIEFIPLTKNLFKDDKDIMRILFTFDKKAEKMKMHFIYKNQRKIMSYMKDNN